MDHGQGRAADALIDAITTMLRNDRPLPSITEVCAASGVSRPTFYQHFGDIPTLVTAAGIERLQALFAAVAPAPGHADWRRESPRVIEALLTALFEDAPFFQRVLDAAGTHAFQERCVDFLSQRLIVMSADQSPSTDGEHSRDDIHLRRTAVFLAAGATWLVVLWVRMETGRPSPAAAAAEISRLITATLAAQSHSA